MEDMIFRGNLKDFLSSKKIDIARLIRYGLVDEQILFNEFQITSPVVDFNNPVDILRIDDDKWSQTFYILKFNISGDTNVLDYKPNTVFATMPEWVIRNGEIWFRIEERDLETMKAVIDGLIETFKSHLLDIEEDIREYNTTLMSDIVKLVRSYNNRISKDNYILEEVRNYILFSD